MQLLNTLSTDETFNIILAIILLGSLSIVCGHVFKLLKMPGVVGEICGGIILGPTILGRFFPDIYHNIFFAFEGEGKALNIMYWLGLILLMLSTGFDSVYNFKKENRKLILALIIGSSLVPFLIGLGISNIFMASYIDSTSSTVAFRVLFGISAAITSIPVISKIFYELGIIDTNFAGIIITTATIEDLIEWVMLSTILGISTTDLHAWNIMRSFFITILLLFLSIWLLPKVLQKGRLKMLDNEKFPLVFCFTYIVIMQVFSVNIIYSALIAGIVIKRSCGSQVHEMMRKINTVAISFFIPVYFALVGIRVDLFNNFNAARFLLFFTLACVIKAGGIVLTLNIADIRKDSIINFAFAMNARGGPGIVLASVGLEYHIISLEFYTALVLTSILSSMLAGYWLRIQCKSREKEVFSLGFD